MASGQQEIVNQLCKLVEESKKTSALLKASEDRTIDVYFVTVPENGGKRTFATGVTKIDFGNGQIVNPDGTVEQLSRRLDLVQDKDVMHSVSIHCSNAAITFSLDTSGMQTVQQEFLFQLPYVTFRTMQITCTESTEISIFACTNPQATLGNFRLTQITDISQPYIVADDPELTTWPTTLVSLSDNMSRIRNQIISITGESWGTVSNSIASILSTITGHDHDGTDSKKVTAANVLNTPAGNIIAIEVQAAIDELDGQDTTHAADTSTHGVAEVADVATVSAEIDNDISTHTALPNAHHNESHNIASHNDTTVTGAELNADHSKLGGIEASADVTDSANVASSIVSVVDKATPVDGDSIGIIDSAAANVLKELTWANIKATLKTYFDGLYNNYSHPNHTGEVTSTGDGATAIADDAVTYAKMQNVSADERILGNVTAIGSPVAELTKAQVLNMLSVEDGSTADQTGAEIKAAYEGEADTNAYNDAAVTKLAGIDTGAKDDQTGAEIKTAYQAEANAYTDAKNTKLAGIDTGADVTADNAPKAHEASHKATGGDEILLDELGTPTDVTTLNSTTSVHGLLPKLGGGSTNYLRADGTWAEPPGGGGAAIASGTYTGNGANNRAIPHGLGVKPKTVLATRADGYFGIMISDGISFFSGSGTSPDVDSQTTMDATNFYVGAGNLNNNTVLFTWVAIV